MVGVGVGSRSFTSIRMETSCGALLRELQVISFLSLALSFILGWNAMGNEISFVFYLLKNGLFVYLWVKCKILV